MTKHHHSSLEYTNPIMKQKLRRIRSSTLRNFVILYNAWKGKNTPGRIFLDLSPDYRWIMGELGCSMRTAYDYAIALSYFFSGNTA